MVLRADVAWIGVGVGLVFRVDVVEMERVIGVIIEYGVERDGVEMVVGTTRRVVLRVVVVVRVGFALVVMERLVVEGVDREVLNARDFCMKVVCC